MRTTLKRGMGRAATVNGNGNGRAVMPPGVAEPMRRYSQPPPPPRSTRSTAGKVFGWILLALVIVVTGLAGGLYLYAHETLNAIAPHSAAVKKSTKDLAVPAPSTAAVALVVGYDARAGTDGFTAKDSRSDTIMLIRADPQTDTLSMLSFPRDLQVPIYCDPTTARTVDRINSAWSTCSVKGTLDTVEKLTGIPVNYLITVNFHGFKLLVNKLHGVYMQIDHRYINTVGGPGGFAKINLEPGYQKLDGEQALDFVRFRHTDSDLYRLARQQLFLEALKDRFASSLSITKLPGIIGTLKHNVEIGRGGGGTPSFTEIESYAGLASNLGGGHLFRVQIPNLVNCGFLNAQVCSTTADIQTAVSSFMHPDVSLPSRANDAALGRKPHVAKQPKLQRSQITALVLNGTTITGLARDTSYKLGVQGFHTVQLPPPTKANTPTSTYTDTYVYYDAVQSNAKEAARQVAIAFGPHTVTAPLPPEVAPIALQAGNPLVVVAVGSSFGGELIDPEANIVATPVRQTPSVTINPSLSESAIRDVRSKLPFRPMVPTAIESSSSFTSFSPVRVYKPSPGQTALCLTYQTGAGNIYWQVMETDWTSAPIIRHPTDKVTIAGRKFDLYTVGGNIH
ncbi:MAG: polyisoprenyl-teichoic acid--peptidoglycan teichoic acid transferase, partial [Actinomycetota bacterium]|nr:polyisoprenyl-teichoic acid--peptidoglycan teichoic acid transferase [Actinomycetota bacterium]